MNANALMKQATTKEGTDAGTAAELDDAGKAWVEPGLPGPLKL